MEKQKRSCSKVTVQPPYNLKTFLSYIFCHFARGAEKLSTWIDNLMFIIFQYNLPWFSAVGFTLLEMLLGQLEVGIVFLLLW